MTALVIPGVPVAERRQTHIVTSPLAACRRGVMLHYDDSVCDAEAVAWFSDPRCTNGYTWLVLDDGRVIELADPALRTPHAGPCTVPRANSAFYGLAAATNGQVLATPGQVSAIVTTCVALFRHHGWPAEEVQQRIVGHDELAIWTADYTRAAGIPDARGRLMWGRLGRKVDPTGVRGDGQKIVDVAAVRLVVRGLLVGKGEETGTAEVRDVA